MDFSTLPSEVQFEYLLGLDPQDVLAYCKTSTSAQQICQDPYFWDLKATRDFGIPYSSIYNLEPYWRYRLMGSLEGYPPMIGPLLRTKRPDLAKRIIEMNGVKGILFDAISTDDPVVLDFVRSYTRGKEDPHQDNLPGWINHALSQGSIHWLKYLTSLDPSYLENPSILNNLLENFIDVGSERAIRLLAPYIEALRRKIPNLTQWADRGGFRALYDYLTQH